MIQSIGTACVTAALLLDTASYWKQIAKTVKTKKSNQISSTSFLLKIAKEVCAIIGLCIFSNWAGVIMGVYMLVVYAVTLGVIIRYKPKGWSLWS